MVLPLPQTRFQVPPLRTATTDEINRWIGHLNRSFAQIAERLQHIPVGRGRLTRDLDAGGFQFTNVSDPTDDDNVVTLGSFDNLLRSGLDKLNLLQTAESEGGSGPGTGEGTSVDTTDDVTAALLNAIPSDAPPDVSSPGSVGTTIDPVLFALSDHTHGGARTAIMSMPLQAGATAGVQDLGYRRSMILMGA